MSSWSREKRKRARERRVGDAKGASPKAPRRKAGNGAEEEARPGEADRESPEAPPREADDVVGSGGSAILNCPKCGSDQTGKASAIYAAGTSTIETKSSGMAVAWAGGRNLIPALGSSSTSGVQQTQLAAQLAPPARGPTVKTFLIGVFLAGPILGVVAYFLAGVLGAVCGFSLQPLVPICFWLGVLVMLAVQALAVWFTVKMYRFNRDEWPGLRAEWEAKWYCGRCGEVFIPESEKAALEAKMEEAARRRNGRRFRTRGQRGRDSHPRR